MGSDLDAVVREAWAAHDRADWNAAIVHWQTCTRLHPGLVTAYWMGGALMLDRGCVDEAEAMLSTGARLDPDNMSLAVKHAQAVTAQQRWADAVALWNALLARAPENREVINARAEAVMRMQMLGIEAALDDEASPIDTRALADAAPASADKQLFLQFESLGDNCEFGLVQRHYGAEPLSLLRWNAIGIEALIAGVEDGFAGVGDPQRTELMVRQHDEYVLVDHRYGMAMHTFIKAAQTPPAAQAGLHGAMCRRQAYLGRMLIESLREATKVFVIKANDGIPADSLRRLHAGMRHYGANRLLYVVQADATRWAGSLEEIAPGLLVGAVERLARNERWDLLAFDSWRDLCRKVVAWQVPVAEADPRPAEPPPAVTAPKPATPPAPVRDTPSGPATAWDVLAAGQPALVANQPERDSSESWFSRLKRAFRRS